VVQEGEALPRSGWVHREYLGPSWPENKVERLKHSGLVLQHDSDPLRGAVRCPRLWRFYQCTQRGGFGSSFSSVAVLSPPTAAFALVVVTLVVVTSAPSPAVATTVPPAVLVPPTAAFALVKVAPAPSPTAATAVPHAVLVPPTAALALVKVAPASTSTAATAVPPLRRRQRQFLQPC
jgi:hypothetical protein